MLDKEKTKYTILLWQKIITHILGINKYNDSFEHTRGNQEAG